MNRNHIRQIHWTPEKPTEIDEEKKDEVKKKLESESVWFYEDKAEGPWYRLNVDEKENKEIMIISNKSTTARPLSQFSSIVRNMGEIKQIRIYVRPEDRKQAEEVLK